MCACGDVGMCTSRDSLHYKAHYAPPARFAPLLVSLARSTHTDLIQLNRKKLRALLTQQRLRLVAIRAVTLAEYRDGVFVNDGLNLGLCGGHCGG